MTLIAGEWLFFYKIRSPFSYFFHSISLTPAFLGLQNFHQGCRLKQWTGDNSKALMKVSICYQYIQQCLLINWQVYLLVIEGYVPSEMINALHTFLEFAHIARCNIHNIQSLEQMDDALQCYHHHCKIFLTTGVQTGFNLPCQHALIHYTKSICLFGSLNGLCSSITESKHIKAVRSHGNNLVALKHFAKCFSLTNVLTSWQLLGLISRNGACSKVHAYHQSCLI